MPEGDTIFRAARTLNRALAGQAVVRFESVYPALTRVHEDTPVTGRTVESVTAAGKHVLMRFAGDLVLRTHMRMSGSWHIYRPGETWRRPRRDMRILIATTPFVAVAFNVPVADIMHARATAEFRQLMEFQYERALAYYSAAFAALPAADRKAQRPGLVMAAIYRAVLAEIRADGMPVLTQRTSLTPLRKLWIAWRTWVKS